MHTCLPLSRTRRPPLAGVLLWSLLLSLLCPVSWAGTFTVGGADGSFESGLRGMVTAGDVRLVTGLGALRPSQGAQALLLSTSPDTGVTLMDETVSTVRLAHVTIPASTTHLRLDWNVLTNELAPSFTNDRFTVRLRTATDETTLLMVDTFTPLFAVPVPGYTRQTGWHTLIADVTAYAGTGEALTLEIALTDVGDGRGNSAVLLDNLRLTAAHEPQACTMTPVMVVAVGTPVFFDGSCSLDSDGMLREYRWNFGDGTVAIGLFPAHAYASDGLYQGTLTVTDATGQTSTTPFLVAVGALTHAPQIVSAPVVLATVHTPYRYAVTVADPDRTTGDVLTFALLEAPPEMGIDPTTGVITWTPAGDAPHHPVVTVQVQDSFGLSATQSFHIVLTHAPQIVTAPVVLATAHTPYRYAVAVADPDRTTGDVLTFTLLEAPLGMGIDPATGMITWAPPGDAPHHPLVTVQVQDSFGLSATQSFYIVLTHAPQIVTAPVVLAAEHTPYRYAVAVEDPDRTTGDVLTFTLLEAPPGLGIDPATGVITWTPSSDAPHHPLVTVQVQDSFGLSATQSFHIVVGPEVYIVAADDTGILYYARSNGDGTFANYRIIGGPGRHTEGVVIADIDGDGDFDVLSGLAQSPTLTLHYYEHQGEAFAPPVVLATLGSTAEPAGDWLIDLAAGDFNNDGQIDVVVNSDTATSWLFLGQGPLTFSQATLFESDFERTVNPWSSATCNTGAVRDDTTAHTGTWSMRVFATGPNSCLTLQFVPTGWDVVQGPTLSFAYRIPPGVPLGFYLYVNNVGWVFVSGTSTAQSGPYPVLAIAPLLDDNAWHTVTLDLYHSILQRWPAAGPITHFEWGTNRNAPAGAQFWLDDVRITRRTYVSGFQVSPLPRTGGYGRGLEAADVHGDGTVDVARARCCDGQVFLYTGDGTGQFTTTLVADAGSDPYGLVLADFDSDGTVDLIANNGSSGDASFFKGHGDGTFRPGVAVPSLDVNTYAAYGAYDFNHDGHQDLVVVGYAARQVWYYPGNGNGTFRPRVVIGTTANNVLGVAAPAGRVPGQPFSVVTVEHDTVAVGETVTFDASGSYDDGTIVSYTWHFGDGTPASGAVVTHQFRLEGVYSVVMTSTDDTGMQDRLRVQITVRGTLPVPHIAGPAVVNETAANGGQWAVTFDARGSQDDRGIVAYTWDFGDHTTSSGVNPTHRYTAPGTYTVTLTVTDVAAQQTTTTFSVVITANAPPVAQAGGPYSVGEAAASYGTWAVTLDGRSSTDDVAVYDYTWAFASAPETFTGTTIDLAHWMVSPEVTQQDALSIVGAAGWGSRYAVRTESVARADGVVFQFQLQAGNPTGSQDAMWGLRHGADSDFSYLTMLYALNFANGMIHVYEDGLFRQTVGTYTRTVLYDVRLTLKAEGARYEIKPATASTWTVLYESTYSTVSPLRVGGTVSTGTFTLDNVQQTAIRTGPVVTQTYRRPGVYTVTLTVRDHALQNRNRPDHSDRNGWRAPRRPGGWPLQRWGSCGVLWDLGRNTGWAQLHG